MNRAKSVLVAACISLALAFTLSCSGDDGEGNSSNSTGGANIFCRTDYTCVSVSAEACFEFGGIRVNSCEAIPPDNSSSGGTQGGNNSSSSSGGTQGGGSGCSIQDYKTVQIGEQIWMAENLNCDVNGSKCYDNDPAYCVKYGRLYDWETAKTVCPSGWHLPGQAEWTMLADYVGGASTAGAKLKATSGWKNSGNGTDDYGFSALPGGKNYTHGDLRPGERGIFTGAGEDGYWWSAIEYSATNANCWYIDKNTRLQSLSSGDNKSYLNSVRCLQD